MHTFKTDDDKTVFNFNSDFSGDVIIKRNGKTVNVPGRDLLALIAEHIRREKISRLENASDMQVLMGDAG